MKKILFYTIALAVCFGFGACSDPGDEITEGNYPRVFSPLNFDASSIKETSAVLKWKDAVGASYYSLEVYADDSLEFNDNHHVADLDDAVADITYTLSGLTYDTRYSVRLTAISGDPTKEDSKYSECTFRTSAQQILSNPKEADILDRSVILSWTEGEPNVTKIVINPGNIVHEITPDEIAASKAVVEGLNPETEYDAYLYFTQNGVDKQRGHRTFTTIADLAGATIVDPTDDFTQMLTDATEGQVFALKPGEFFIGVNDEGKTGAVTVTKSVTIKGIYPTSTPVIYGRFQLEEGAGIVANNVIFDGTNNGTTDQTFVYKTADVVYAPLTLTNSEIRNFGKGVYYVNVKCTVESMTFENCLIHGIACDGGDMFDCRKGYIKTLTFAKSTLWNEGTPADRDCIRYDDASADFPDVAGPVINVENCTFHNFGKSHGMLYVRFAGNVSHIKNNLLVNINNYWSNQSKTNAPEFVGNAYFNSANMVTAPTAGVYDESGKVVADPNFKNPANGDFTILNEDVKKLNVGDPRWLK